MNDLIVELTDRDDKNAYARTLEIAAESKKSPMYRTVMSKKNADTWAFAHDYCGRLWIKIGVLLVPTVAAQLPFAHAGENVIGTAALIIEAVQLAVLLGSVAAVEKALKRTFDEKGVRR